MAPDTKQMDSTVPAITRASRFSCDSRARLRALSISLLRYYQRPLTQTLARDVDMAPLEEVSSCEHIMIMVNGRNDGLVSLRMERDSIRSK